MTLTTEHAWARGRRALDRQPSDRREAWGTNETARLHYVLLPAAEDPTRVALFNLEPLLGAPHYLDCDVAIRHMPGVGKPLHAPSPSLPRHGASSGGRAGGRERARGGGEGNEHEHEYEHEEEDGNEHEYEHEHEHEYEEEDGNEHEHEEGGRERARGGVSALRSTA